MIDSNENDWETLILDFLLAKFEADLSRFTKETFKNVQKLITKSNTVSEYFEDFLDTRKNKQPDNISEKSFLMSRMDSLFEHLELTDIVDKTSLKSDYTALIDKLNKKYEANAWIEDASNNASSITFATHVAKLTHSKIDSSSLNDTISSSRPDVLTTSSLSEIIIDGAVAGNQYAPIYQFLSLEHDGVNLAQAFTQPSNNLLKSFAKDEVQLAEWNERFRQVTQPSTLSTHSLAKQVYFPVNSDTLEQARYHLLCPIISSSLAQHIFTTLFNDELKLSRKQYFDKKYHADTFYDYPQKSAIAVTASNHSNASQLNGKRGGKLYLFNTKPPMWQAQIKPPNFESNMFNHEPLNYLCTDNLKGFQAMFLGAVEVYRKPHIMAGIEKWIQAISDDVIAYASLIQQLPAGWSAGSKLESNNIEHCYFLDCNRQDDAFVIKQQSNDWQRVVAHDFGNWINNKLNKNSKSFTPQAEHRKLWQKLFAQQLRDYLDIFIVENTDQQAIDTGAAI